jgi:hypothetical protein
MENLGKEHWPPMKWVLRYLRGTSNYSITYDGSTNLVCSYVNSYFAGDLDKRRWKKGETQLIYPVPRQNICLLHMHARRQYG